MNNTKQVKPCKSIDLSELQTFENAWNWKNSKQGKYVKIRNKKWTRPAVQLKRVCINLYDISGYFWLRVVQDSLENTVQIKHEIQKSKEQLLIFFFFFSFYKYAKTNWVKSWLKYSCSLGVCRIMQQGNQFTLCCIRYSLHKTLQWLPIKNGREK